MAAIVDFSAVRVVVRREDAVLDQRSDFEIAETFTK